jgi:hypothetical protein
MGMGFIFCLDLLRSSLTLLFPLGGSLLLLLLLLLLLRCKFWVHQYMTILMVIDDSIVWIWVDWKRLLQIVACTMRRGLRQRTRIVVN